ncbi:MAG: YibE/F family protein [Patescibacteria group bacterium]|nr:YibE/F family protein [Patescibacteria group bacterium]
MKKLFLIAVLFITFSTLSFGTIKAQENNQASDEEQLQQLMDEQMRQQLPPPPKEEIFRARVDEIVEEGNRDIGGYQNMFQKVKVRILDGAEKDSVHEIEHGGAFRITDQQKVKAGDNVVLLKYTPPGSESQYHIVDKYRLDVLYVLLFAFFVLIFTFSRWKGIGSFLGLILSFVIIIKYMVPQIVAGTDPLQVSIISSLIIMTTTIYLAHGFSKQTSVALLGTAISLVLTGLLSILIVDLANLSGLGSDDAYSLRLGQTADINFKGLLLAGMIIGVLGVLDDITTSLSASVFEVARANPKQKFKDLVASGLRVGREHVASLVNTLILAYAGSSLPILLFIVINPNNIPLWAIVNSELITEEIVRMLSGSIGLLTAVPITVLLAAKFASRETQISALGDFRANSEARVRSRASSKKTLPKPRAK